MDNLWIRCGKELNLSVVTGLNSYVYGLVLFSCASLVISAEFQL